MILNIPFRISFFLQLCWIFFLKDIQLHLKQIMSKNTTETTSHAKRQNEQITRLGYSLIINSPVTIQQSNLSPKPMKNYNNDDPFCKQIQLAKHGSAEQNRSFKQFSNKTPLNQMRFRPKIIDEPSQKQNTQIHTNVNQRLVIRKKDSTQHTKDLQKNNLTKSGDRTPNEASSTVNSEHLSSYKSQKMIPSFIRNQIKSPDRIKTNGRKAVSIQNFKTIKRLGVGKFGVVNLAREIYTGMVFAVKILNKKKIMSDGLLTQFIRQLKIQTFLDHPNIIKTFAFFSDQKYFYTVLQLGSDGQLYDFIATGQTLSEESTSFIIGNLLDAVCLMHKHKILHRDIKPENIVLTHGNVKLCDFGWAVDKKKELRGTFCGTPLYLSPELLQGQLYDQKVDLWAIGILAYELYMGHSPFQINQQEDLAKIITQDVTFPTNRKISIEFKSFIQAILKKNPKERLSSNDLLNLDFIKKYKDLETCEELCQ